VKIKSLCLLLEIYKILLNFTLTEKYKITEKSIV